MDGRPLYEYAREGVPLPRPIEKRQVTVHSLELVDWKAVNEHAFRYPTRKFTEEQKKAVEKAMAGVEDQVRVDDQPEEEGSGGGGGGREGGEAVACVLRMEVSGGTYVRSIVHDLGHAVGSAAHVVTLTRSRQGRFTLEPRDGKETAEDDQGGEAVAVNEAGGEAESDVGCVPWEVVQRALEDPGEPDEDGWREWEREVLDKLEVVDGPLAKK